MDKVSFKGYNNILQNQLAEATGRRTDLIVGQLVAQVTGKDLIGWKHVLERFPENDMFSPSVFSQNRKFITLEHVCETPSKTCATPDTPCYLYLNDNLLEANDENLPAFHQISNFLKHVTTIADKCRLEKQESPIIYNENYSDSLGRMLQQDLSLISPDEVMNKLPIERFQNIGQIGKMARFMNEVVKIKMNNFFKINGD